jgi:hypothetical protein
MSTPPAVGISPGRMGCRGYRQCRATAANQVQGAKHMRKFVSRVRNFPELIPGILGYSRRLCGMGNDHWYPHLRRLSQMPHKGSS